ncbi:hypothetical protein KUTeg_024649 [Tegillarca granosa]|uniref:DDE-1 domain-containing protein n=1 Tax=Tegillarca granosa TaxID=220873 RepID=A0ABQ9DXY6_TEGGR|nr:hypothetical protein KUTeg_024649 [Tegillarca granosa]
MPPWEKNKSAKSRCFSSGKSMPVTYQANERTWMTSELYEKSLRDANESIKQKQKILLSSIIVPPTLTLTGCQMLLLCFYHQSRQK